MAKQPETTSAAVWNPPRLFKLNVRLFGSDGPRGPSATIWEGGDQAPGDHCTKQYRMPTSSEPVSPLFLLPHCPTA